MFSYCSRGRVRSSDEWYINVPIPSPSCVSPQLPRPVTAMMWERWDEFVRRDLILLSATSPVNSCPFCHCRFQAVSRLCRVGNGRRPDLSESWLYWIIPHSLVPLREVELSSLPVALKNTWLQCSWSSKGSSCPPCSSIIHIYYSLCKLKVYLCMPKSLWTTISTYFVYCFCVCFSEFGLTPIFSVYVKS